MADFLVKGGLEMDQDTGKSCRHEDGQGKAWNSSFPHSPQKKPILPTSSSWTSSLQDSWAVNVCFNPPGLWNFVIAALGT